MPTSAPELPPPAIRANQHVYNDYFRPEFTDSLDQNLLLLLDRVWFRSRLVGFAPFPARNDPAKPLIFASNHSGMAFPWDAIVGLGRLWRTLGNQPQMPRPLSAAMLSQTTLMNPYLIRDFWLRVGSVPATTLNFETMMYQPGHNLMVYPEGIAGIGKGFNHKYELQRLATSFVRMSLKHGTDIMPFYTINAEYLNPFAYSFKWVDWLVRKIGIPFLPLTPLLLLMLVQPWVFYFALPAQLTFVMGTRICPRELTTQDPATLTRADYEALGQQVRQRMQAELSAAVAAHGQRPYRWRELWQRMKENRRYFPFFLPFAWPVLFAEFERRYVRRGERRFTMPLDRPGEFWRYVWRNPLTLAYFVPLLGWVPLAIKGYRRHRLWAR